MSSLTVANVNTTTSTPNSTTTSSTSFTSSCQLCVKLISDDSIWIRPFSTIQCIYCNRNVCSSCCTSIAHDSQLPFPNNHQHVECNKNTNIYKLTPVKQYICFECIIQDRHQIIMKSVYKAIGHIIDINIISIISLFSIQECMDCNKTYPKSWSIIQPDIMEKICSKYFKPHTLSIHSLFTSKTDQYELRYCKHCHNDNESSIIFDAVYNAIDQQYDGQKLQEIMDIIDIITSYSVGSILTCSNFENCNNEIIINNNFNGFVEGKDISNNKITFNKALDKIFCDECTVNEHRENGVAEYCALCDKCTLFGENVTCYECGDRFCYDCLNKQENEYLIETKYYFERDDDNDIEKIKYYQYCDNCHGYITDDIDIMDDCISSISFDPYQELINDYNYTDYQQIDSYFYGPIQEIVNSDSV